METAGGFIEILILLFSGPAGPILAVLLALLGLVLPITVPGPTP